ncbi:hypothetical protein KCMC57_up32820 [Kitasatospora sp. CMC57]|uniref:Uncharacterized protein n=2 Tax=Kitasatospora sp. CMC57 TaxID=3231513 RepID=A0AB33JWD8_9ACTN
MRAEYGPAGKPGGVKSWHITVGNATTAMCGHELETEAEVREPVRWAEEPGLNCHTCGALFLREVPYLPSEHLYREQP